ncbi:DUF2934 domain-containing protein [Sphingomonas sp. gentR]|jgi:hypothetical protein|uniref:DUF2934 domain-containing protein n=1 Tax=unclassified Sphingomonas TaxID=196159 RepID=UPI000972AABA|nr:DUF2934 domain-containing protein [Sphingomonas sp. LK11]APX66224.1 hypothetical protein AV944_10755 [Sphingomonas sp. LK11]
MNDRGEQLRQRAYGIWQSEGEPHGRDRDHWEQAERELTEVVLDEPAAPAKPAVRRKKADAAPQTIAAEPKPRAPRKPRAKTA